MTSQTKPANQRAIDFQSDLAELAKLREFCSDVFSLACPNRDVREDDKFINVQLALNEACANVMEHGYDFVPEQPIRCVASWDDKQLCFHIEHEGKAFVEPEQIAQIDRPLEGGMGLFLIQQCVDQVQYCQTDSGRQCIRLFITIP